MSAVPTGLAEAADEPMEGSPERTYRRFLDGGEFRIQRCGDCDGFMFPPAAACRRCGGERLAWTRPAGTGRVYSTTTVRRRPDRGGDYNVCLVDLDEGVRLMSRVEGIPPAEVAIGMRVAARVGEAEGGGIVLFGPAEDRHES